MKSPDLKSAIFIPSVAAVCWVSGLEPWSVFLLSWLGWASLFFAALNEQIPKRVYFLICFLAAAIYFGCGLQGIRLFSVSAYVILTLLMAAVLTTYLFSLRLLFAKRSFPLSLAGTLLLYLIFDSLLLLSPIGNIGLESLFYGPLAVLQTAAIPVLGYKTTVLIVLGFNFSLAWGLAKKQTGALLWALGFALALTALTFWGHHRLSGDARSLGKRIALIQHNLPMGDPWADEHAAEILQTYEGAALEAAASKPDLMVFPFYDLPQDPERHPEWPQKLAEQIGIPLILGAHIPVTSRDRLFSDGYQSKLFYFHPEARESKVYEAVLGAPFQPIPEKTAAEYKVLETPTGKIGALICYEDTRPQVVRKAKKLGAQFLVSLSNPGHFQKTQIPRYHLIQDQLRALETGLPLVRVSANGYSAFIDSHGRILQKTELSEKKVLVQTI